jgi:hypothetical protein
MGRDGMTEAIDVIVSTREGAYKIATAAYERARGLIADGKRARFRLEEAEDELSIRQRGFLHKAVLPQISEQVTFPDGTRFEWRVWKEMFRARFLGDRWVLKAVPRWDDSLRAWVKPKRKTPHRERVSTEDLGLKAYSEYIDLVIDTAVLEFGVAFVFLPSERDAVRYRAPARKRAEAAA